MFGCHAFENMFLEANPESPLGETERASFVVFDVRLPFAYSRPMGLDIGGYEQSPDWPKMGPSLLIATCLILAIRTAKWPRRSAGTTASDEDLESEIAHSAHLAGRVFAHLVSAHPSLFPSFKKPWYAPNGEDWPK